MKYGSCTLFHSNQEISIQRVPSNYCGVISFTMLINKTALDTETYTLFLDPSSFVFMYCAGFIMSITRSLHVFSNRDIHFCLCATVRTLLRRKYKAKQHTHIYYSFFHLFSIYLSKEFVSYVCSNLILTA